MCKPIQKWASLSGGRPNVHQICQFSKVGFGVHSRHLPKTRAVYIEGTKIRQMELAHAAAPNTSPILWGSVIPPVPICRSEHFPNSLGECYSPRASLPLRTLPQFFGGVLFPPCQFTGTLGSVARSTPLPPDLWSISSPETSAHPSVSSRMAYRTGAGSGSGL